jgi:AcrR family transcriptional regulator
MPMQGAMPSPEPRPPLNRERVLRAAVKLTDEGGIESLTMRELGLRLGVEAMSLYNHVTNKDDILDGMVDLVVSEIDLPPDTVGWRQAMRRRAISAQAVFDRHPWASRLIDSRQSSGPARLHYFDWMVGTLRRSGFTMEMTARAFSVLDSYIYGFGRQQLNMSAGPDVDPEEVKRAFLQGIPAEEYPNLREMVAEYAMNASHDESADFEFGLDLILDGLQRLLDAATSQEPAASADPGDARSASVSNATSASS